MNALFCQEAKLGIALTRYSTTLWRPNRRIHALKAKALLSGSGMERGFGSVFRHQHPRANRNGWPFFLPATPVLARFPGGALRTRTPPERRSRPDRASLFSLFLCGPW